jgi:hypothetical protein
MLSQKLEAQNVIWYGLQIWAAENTRYKQYYEIHNVLEGMAEGEFTDQK